MSHDYQIHATKAILRSMRKDESGHIWHTTGSGKSLTSYKTSKTILRRKSLDKVLFLVDRKSLDEQTTNESQSSARLLNGNREVLVTTAQKLNHLIKRYDKDIDIDSLTKK